MSRMRDNTVYLLAVECRDGNEIFGFRDEADLCNFIMDIENNVGKMALAVATESPEGTLKNYEDYGIKNPSRLEG